VPTIVIIIPGNTTRGNGKTIQKYGGPARPRPYCPTLDGGPFSYVRVLGVQIKLPPRGPLVSVQITALKQGITVWNCPPHSNACAFCGVAKKDNDVAVNNIMPTIKTTLFLGT
tara:strand:- start:469 stop:807 length:339 start_codon:yes stop_codon:yes gene_type:complete